MMVRGLGFGSRWLGWGSEGGLKDGYWGVWGGRDLGAVGGSGCLEGQSGWSRRLGVQRHLGVGVAVKGPKELWWGSARLEGLGGDEGLGVRGIWEVGGQLEWSRSWGSGRKLGWLGWESGKLGGGLGGDWEPERLVWGAWGAVMGSKGHGWKDCLSGPCCHPRCTCGVKARGVPYLPDLPQPPSMDAPHVPRHPGLCSQMHTNTHRTRVSLLSPPRNPCVTHMCAHTHVCTRVSSLIVLMTCSCSGSWERSRILGK